MSKRKENLKKKQKNTKVNERKNEKKKSLQFNAMIPCPQFQYLILYVLFCYNSFQLQNHSQSVFFFHFVSFPIAEK